MTPQEMASTNDAAADTLLVRALCWTESSRPRPNYQEITERWGGAVAATLTHHAWFEPLTVRGWVMLPPHLRSDRVSPGLVRGFFDRVDGALRYCRELIDSRQSSFLLRPVGYEEGLMFRWLESHNYQLQVHPNQKTATINALWFSFHGYDYATRA